MSELNPEQKLAVETTEGPLLVLAGAGAGKTRVIAHRILQIVKKEGVAPAQILAITFTNKAAAEMRERVMNILSEDATKPMSSDVQPRRGYPNPSAPFVSTFHSLGLHIIKENYRLMGFKRTPAIYDRSDSMREIKAALKDIDGDFEARSVLSAISRHKGDGLVASEFSESATEFRDSVVARVWQRYDEKLAKDHALDFDDLLLRSTRFLEHNETARAHYQARRA
jgi:DNA helicase-2/ATP-dependent DNA helicase PcrA